jgi:hypothetical protein
MKSEIAMKGAKFYDKHLKQILEATHQGEFVAIEPESGQYFLGKTGGEAIYQGNEAFPDKKLFLVRVGAAAAYKIKGFDGRRRGASQ